MKNREIHNGLEHKQVRDFLSNQQVQFWYEKSQLKKKTVPNGLKGFEYEIAELENELFFKNELLNICRGLDAINKLIYVRGWEEFDVSDYVEHDSPYTYYNHFIGTKEEYETFISKFKK